MMGVWRGNDGSMAAGGWRGDDDEGEEEKAAD